MEEIWLGTEASYQTVTKYQEKFLEGEVNKEAFYRSPFDRDEPELCPVFGVDSQRVGLTLLRKVGETTVLQVHGSLTPNFSRWHMWVQGSVVSYEAIRDALAICEETGIKELVMHFDSNGGSVRGLSQTSDAMKRYQRLGGKLIGHSDSLCASAGYWLMCGCNQVSSSEMAELGSIGTMAVVTTMVNTEENRGVTFTVIKAGKFKAIGNPYEKLTDETKAYLQKNIDETNQFFLNRVSLTRNLMLSETGVWAEGQMFFAQRAMQVGLIDKVATMDDIIGSGPAAVNPSDTRRFEMEISAEKLAQIQAGADPKVVLTAQELEVYLAGVEAAKVDTGAEEKTAEQAAPEKVAAGNVQVEDAPVGQISLSDELRKALKDLGSTEAKLEARDIELAKLQEANESLSKSMDALLVVAQGSITNLQVALGKPREAKATVAEVLAQHNELQGQMAAVFKTGKNTASDPVVDTTVKPGGAIDYRLKHAASTKTGR